MQVECFKPFQSVCLVGVSLPGCPPRMLEQCFLAFLIGYSLSGCLQNAENISRRIQLHTKDVDFASRLWTTAEPRQRHACQEEDENLHRQTSQWGAGSWVSQNDLLSVFLLVLVCVAYFVVPDDT